METREEAPDQIIKCTKAAIRTLRGAHVILDADLAAIFGVETKRLNEQAKRNPEKFREDFRFRLSDKEFQRLKSQNATSKRGGIPGVLLPSLTRTGLVKTSCWKRLKVKA